MNNDNYNYDSDISDLSDLSDDYENLNYNRKSYNIYIYNDNYFIKYKNNNIFLTINNTFKKNNKLYLRLNKRINLNIRI